MKKIFAIFLVLCCVVGLAACGGNEAQSVDDLIADAPSITGVVTEVHDKYIVVQGEPNELYHLSEEYHVSLPAEYENPDTSYSVGDEVIVYYDGNIAESDPLQINEVLAITWKSPATNTDISALALSKEIPGLTISYGEEEINAWLGGHSWIYEDENGAKNAIMADSSHPLYCMETMSFIPVYATTVSHAVGYEPGQVTLNFDVEPTKITVYRYDVEAADETAGEEIIMDNGYVLDLAYGNYLYHIAAEWDYPEGLGGSGDYAFYTNTPEIHNAVVSIVDTTKTSDIGYDTALEKFYENETTQYYFDGIKSEYIIVKYSDGTEKNIKDAFENGDVTISDLDKFDIDYITTPYKCKEE